MRLVSTLANVRLQVTDHGDGTLGTTMAPIQLLPDATWLPTGEWVFAEQGGRGTLVCESDETGAVDGLHVAGAQLFSMEPIAWFESAAFLGGLPALFLAVALVAALGWPEGSSSRSPSDSSPTSRSTWPAYCRSASPCAHCCCHSPSRC